MGETGVGKTSLVNYLAKVIDAECITLNVHAGITEQEIIKNVMVDYQRVAREQPLCSNKKDKRKVIIFFDEINTNSSISGLLKEIFVDRHIQGYPLESNICLVSACNPYKLRSIEQSS